MISGEKWRAWRRLPHAAEHSSWKPPPVEAEAPPDRSFIKGKRQQPQTSGMAPAKRKFQLLPEKSADLRLINPAKQCREACESSENRIFT